MRIHPSYCAPIKSDGNPLTRSSKLMVFIPGEFLTAGAKKKKNCRKGKDLVLNSYEYVKIFTKLTKISKTGQLLAPWFLNSMRMHLWCIRSYGSSRNMLRVYWKNKIGLGYLLSWYELIETVMWPLKVMGPHRNYHQNWCVFVCSKFGTARAKNKKIMGKGEM